MTLDPDPALAEAARRFVDDVGRALEEIAAGLPDVDATKVRDDAMMEAFNLAAAFIDSDGLETDDELWAFIHAFAPHYGGNLLHATPREVRASGLVAGKRTLLDRPSALLEILLSVDARDGSDHARTYYRRAMEIAHTVASLDAHVSRTELLAIETYRTTLLSAIDRRQGAATRRGPTPGSVTHGGRPPAPDEAPPTTPDTSAAAGAPGPTAAATVGGDLGGDPDDRPPLPPPRPLDELLAELDGLVGLAEVKAEVKLVANLLRVQQLRRERHLATVASSRHLVFAGNPGTGKTTVARLVAEIYRTLGVVARGHLVETDRSGLVAGYVGQTATKVMAAFDEADGGVLLVDEAYSLVRGGENDFGREAIDTIVKAMEDRRDRVVVIVAGYPDEMDGFMDANPGLRSRFPKTIEFPDYSTDELIAIFESIAEGNHYRLSAGARERVRAWLDAFPRGKGFGNGRLARNLFEDAVGRHASRVVTIQTPTDDHLVTLEPDDIAPPGEGPAHRPSPADPVPVGDAQDAAGRAW